MADFPFIQGRAKSFASIEIKLDGLPPVTGFKSLKWTNKLTPAKGWGTGTNPKYRSRGKADFEAEITGYKDVIDALRVIFAARNLLSGYMLYEFPIVAQWSEFDGGPISNVSLERCRIEEESDDQSEGEELATTTWKLSVMGIKRDGLPGVMPNLQ